MWFFTCGYESCAILTVRIPIRKSPYILPASLSQGTHNATDHGGNITAGARGHCLINWIKKREKYLYMYTHKIDESKETNLRENWMLLYK